MLKPVKKLEDATKDNCLLSYDFRLKQTPNGSLVLESSKRTTRIGGSPEKVVAAISCNIKDKRERTEVNERLTTLIDNIFDDEEIVALLVQKGILDLPKENKIDHG